LIVAGIATVAVTILHRMGGPSMAAQSTVLDEPAGTRIISVSAYGNRLAVVLQGGGPDRIAIVDPATGQHLGGVSLRHP
jgi:hypothetical protein